MKNFYKQISVKIILLFIFTLVLTFTPDCKNPNDNKPPEDSLLPPPEPPELLTPPDSFVHMPLGNNRLFISWNHIEGAEIYEINFVNETMDEWTTQADTNFLNQNWFERFGKFTWKVRAYGPAWEYFTDWSMPRHFEVRLPFDPPALLSPPNDTIFSFDSLPANINFQWSKINEARFYVIQIYIDTTLIYEITTKNVYETALIDSVATYYWQVRADNNHWEYPTGWSARKRFFVQLRSK